MIIAFLMLIFGGFLVTPHASLDLPSDLDSMNVLPKFEKNLRLWNHGNPFGKWMLKMKKILEGPGKKEKKNNINFWVFGSSNINKSSASFYIAVI